MEWLVSMTFNNGIEHYARCEEGECAVWVSRAIQLARWMGDEGEMKSVLEGKFAKLRYEGSH